MKAQNSVLLLVMALLNAVPVLYGQEIIDVPWTGTCQAAAGRPVRLTTRTGDTVDGSCLSVNVNEVAVQTWDHRTVRIARAALARIVIVPQQNQMKALGREMHRSLKSGFQSLLTPAGPGAVIAISGTLAWGAVATPFCILGDLFAKNRPQTEIRTH